MRWDFFLSAVTILMFPAVAEADTGTTVGSHGDWRVIAAVDEMTDKRWFGTVNHASGGAELQVDCLPSQPKKLNVSFRSADFMGNGMRDLVYRVPPHKAHTVTASYSDKSAFLICEAPCSASYKTKPDDVLLNEVSNGGTLLVRFENFQFETKDVVFNVDGAKEAFAEVIGGCERLANEHPK
ncbi:hypothetical protein NFI95_06010 [Acetobacteraceae bacterium KSS8]|uniref:Uncharacterized protein n=1 Tax=Endosaccharibacter trunci TaxID=2812733 RepID=A0ABT1W545_9PROT|nr:hypothetical protein [Acetobacteraceae bacterium KSS8]